MNDLEACRNRWSWLWVVGGNFNRGERNKDTFSCVCADEFRDTLDHLELIGLLLSQNKWICSNKRIKPMCLRIERFLVSMDCQLHESNMCQKHLHRIISDHFPICLMADNIIPPLSV